MIRNVLADFHHNGLYYSLLLLFEKRLGWNLYRPIGYDWYTKGFWAYSNNSGVVKQYLEIPNEANLVDGVYNIPIYEGTEVMDQKSITLDTFKYMHFDYVLASVVQHEKPYARLIQEFQKEAKLIRVLGNNYDSADYSVVKNVMNSTSLTVPSDINGVRYRQEFSLNDFRYEVPKEHNVIKTFMNCVPVSLDANLWPVYKQALPEFTWKMHGSLGENGILSRGDLVKAMQETSWFWHVKFGGDGFGHVIHQAYALGRPAIVKRGYYADKMAGQLLEDNVTCIDLEAGTKDRNVQKIRLWSKPENHIEICKNAYERFKQVVNFDKDEQEIRRFLERCI